MKINSTRKMIYASLNFVAGINDFTLAVRKPDGSLLDPAPTVLHQGDGVYEASYIVDAVGTWQEKVESVSNGDKIVKSFVVVEFDADSVKAQCDVIESGVVDNSAKLDAIDTKLDNLNETLGGYFA